MLALRQVAKARGGVSAIARKSKLTREATYRMLSETGNPALSSLTAVLAATGLQFSVKPIAHPKVRRREKLTRAAWAATLWSSSLFSGASPHIRHRSPPLGPGPLGTLSVPSAPTRC